VTWKPHVAGITAWETYAIAGEENSNRPRRNGLGSVFWINMTQDRTMNLLAPAKQRNLFIT